MTAERDEEPSLRGGIPSGIPQIPVLQRADKTGKGSRLLPQATAKIDFLFRRAEDRALYLFEIFLTFRDFFPLRAVIYAFLFSTSAE